MDQQTSTFRFRFSLLSFLLAVTVICLALSHWNNSLKLVAAMAELRKLRDEVGNLSIEDRSKFHAIAIESDEPNTWRWRMFVPKGVRYQWNISCENISSNIPPKEAGTVGVSNDSYSDTENEVFVTARLREGDNGSWTLSVSSKIGDSKHQMYGSRITIPPDKIEWRSKTPATSGQVIGSNGTEVRDPKGPIILLEERACEKGPNGNYQSSDGPMPGFMIWLSTW